MSDNLESYQSKETQWRWTVLHESAVLRLQEAREELGFAESELEHIEAHPPLSHLFNWSA